MISRRVFSHLPVAAAAVAVSAATAAAEDDNQEGQEGQGIEGSWNTLMTFSAAPPSPLPPSFWIIETFIAQGDYISMAALPSTTSAHGSWGKAEDQKIKTRSRLFVLPQLLGVLVKLEITELITLDAKNNSYTGTFVAVFAPDVGSPFTLTGTPSGTRIPPA